MFGAVIALGCIWVYVAVLHSLFALSMTITGIPFFLVYLGVIGTVFKRIGVAAWTTANREQSQSRSRDR